MLKNSYYPYVLFAMQIIAHLSILPFVYYANFDEWLIMLVILFAGSCLGGTVTYHRLLSHRSWNCPKWLETLFVMVETVMLSGSAIAWVAIHREHHKYPDSLIDPHSPKHKGFLYVHFMSMFVKPKIKYAVDLIKIPFYKFQHQYYFIINLLYATILFLLDPFAVVYAWLVPAALVWNSGSAIISFSHKDGKPNNNFLLGLVTFGEGWHKNHHDNWRRKRLHKYDVGGIIIEGIEYVEKAFRTSSTTKT